MTFTQWIEATWVSDTLRSIRWLWSWAETFHFIGLTLLIGFVGFLDLRLMGFMKGVPISAARKFMPWAIFGFGLNVVTGLIFFLTFPARYTDNGAFFAKMFCICVAGLNAMFFVTRLGTRVLAIGPNDDPPVSFKIVGTLSLVSWLAVLYFGRMLPYLWQGIL